MALHKEVSAIPCPWRLWSRHRGGRQIISVEGTQRKSRTVPCGGDTAREGKELQWRLLKHHAQKRSCGVGTGRGSEKDMIYGVFSPVHCGPSTHRCPAKPFSSVKFEMVFNSLLYLAAVLYIWMQICEVVMFLHSDYNEGRFDKSTILSVAEGFCSYPCCSIMEIAESASSRSQRSKVANLFSVPSARPKRYSDLMLLPDRLARPIHVVVTRVAQDGTLSGGFSPTEKRSGQKPRVLYGEKKI